MTHTKPVTMPTPTCPWCQWPTTPTSTGNFVETGCFDGDSYCAEGNPTAHICTVCKRTFLEEMVAEHDECGCRNDDTGEPTGTCDDEPLPGQCVVAHCGADADLRYCAEHLEQYGTDDDEEAAGPGDEDITTTDERSFYLNGHRIIALTIEEADDAAEPWRSLDAWMTANNYFPTVWSISDHGNERIMRRPIAEATA